ncbi:MAG: enoyl-CoA hydratase [Paracoccaceae bacterium]
MTDTPLLRHDMAGIATLTLNAPGSLNALSDAMLTALSAELSALKVDATIRVVILRATGRAFCAGHDLKEMQAARQASDKGAAYFADLFQRCAAVMQAIVALPQPVIAEVHAIAAAAGCQLVASCDMVVASEQAKFGVNGVNIGLFCSTPMVALTRKIAPAIAFEMLTTGAFIDAERAAAVGLVNHVAPHDALETHTRSLAETVARKLTAAVKIGKSAFYDQIDMPLSAAYDLTGAVMVENMLWRDTTEGISAFLEKREPDWP